MSEEGCAAMCVCLRVWVCVNARLGVGCMGPWVLSQPVHQTLPFPIIWA